MMRGLRRRAAGGGARPLGRVGPAAAVGARRPPRRRRPARRASPSSPRPTWHHRARPGTAWRRQLVGVVGAGPRRRGAARRRRGGRGRRPRPAAGRGGRADGPQRRRQVLAAVGAAGQRAAHVRHGAGGRRRRRRPPPPRRPRHDARAVGLVPQSAVGPALPRHGRGRVRAGRPREPARRRAPARALLERIAPGIDPALHPRDLSPRASGSRSSWPSSSPPTRPCCCSTSRPAGLDYAAKARSARGACASSPRQGRAVLLSTHDVEFVARRRRPGGGARRRRGRRRRPDRRGRRLLPGVRPAGREGDSRPAAGSPSTTCGRRSRTVRRDRHAPAPPTAVEPLRGAGDRAATALDRGRRPGLGRRRAGVRLAAAGRPRRGARARHATRRSSSGCCCRCSWRSCCSRSARAASTSRRWRCSACCPPSAPRCARSAPAPPGSRRCSSCWCSAAACSGPGSGSSSARPRCSRRPSSPAGSGRGCRSRCSAPRGSGSAPGCCRGRGAAPRSRCSPPTARSPGYAYGFLMNLSFWPFARGDGTGLSFVARRPAAREPAPVRPVHAWPPRSAGTSAGPSPTSC